MSEPETEKTSTPGTTSTSSFVDYLKEQQGKQVKEAYVAVNSIPASKLKAVVKLPELPETKQTGYVLGKPKQITCCTIVQGSRTFYVEKNAAYDYIMMSNAAAKDGISIPMNAAFRTNEFQTKLWLERQNPAVAKERGVAAQPGYSNHQSGMALDLEVGMPTPAHYINKQFSKAYKWLEAHAADFGFDHAEGHKVNEAWHWTHLIQEVFGVQAFELATGFTVQITGSALAAVSLNQSGTTRAAALEVHDLDVGYSRASAQQSSTRFDLQRALAEFSANQSNGTGNKISGAEAATLGADPTSFDSTSLAPFSYDFSTGTWGDNKAV